MLENIVKSSGYKTWEEMVDLAKVSPVLFVIPRYYNFRFQYSFEKFKHEVIPEIIKEKLILEYNETDNGIYLRNK